MGMGECFLGFVPPKMRQKIVAASQGQIVVLCICEQEKQTYLEQLHQSVEKIFHFAHLKSIFFYFILPFLQNTHINLSIIHLYSNKIFIFLPYFIILFAYFLHSLSLPLRPNHHHHQYSIGEPLKIKPTQDQKTIQDQINPRSETHLGRNPLNLKAKSSPTQPKTH